MYIYIYISVWNKRLYDHSHQSYTGVLKWPVDNSFIFIYLYFIISLLQMYTATPFKPCRQCLNIYNKHTNRRQGPVVQVYEAFNKTKMLDDLPLDKWPLNWVLCHLLFRISRCKLFTIYHISSEGQGVQYTCIIQVWVEIERSIAYV